MNIIVMAISTAFPLLIIFGFIMLIAYILKNKRTYQPEKRPTAWPYGSRTVSLSSSEISLYKALKLYLPASAIICPKMNLKDILYVKDQQGKSFQYYYKRLVYHTADFMLLSATDFKPVCGVISRVTKDEKRLAEIQDMKQVFDAAGIPLLIMESKSSYSAEDLESHLGKFFKIETVAVDVEQSSDKKVLCPKCGEEMIKRTAKQGENMGKTFYGCSKYPVCKGIVNLT